MDRRKVLKKLIKAELKNYRSASRRYRRDMNGVFPELSKFALKQMHEISETLDAYEEELESLPPEDSATSQPWTGAPQYSWTKPKRYGNRYGNRKD